MKCCEEYASALSALIDGELNDTEREEVLAHLETCEGCRKFFAELMAMHDVMGELEEFDAPKGFADGVMARVHEAPKKKRTPRAAWLSLAACAAVVLVAVGGPLRDAEFAAGKAAPEAAMLMAPAAEPKECAEEEYEDNCVCVQSAPRTMVTMDGAGDYKEKVSGETGAGRKTNELDASAENAAEEIDETGFAANDASFANEAQLPRSVVFVYGTAREDYLIDAAVSFDYDANGTVTGYDLPAEKLGEFLALLDAAGVEYDSCVAKQATTFYVQYEEAGANG